MMAIARVVARQASWYPACIPALRPSPVPTPRPTWARVSSPSLLGALAGNTTYRLGGRDQGGRRGNRYEKTARERENR